MQRLAARAESERLLLSFCVLAARRDASSNELHAELYAQPRGAPPDDATLSRRLSFADDVKAVRNANRAVDEQANAGVGSVAHHAVDRSGKFVEADPGLPEGATPHGVSSVLLKL